MLNKGLEPPVFFSVRPVVKDSRDVLVLPQVDQFVRVVGVDSLAPLVHVRGIWNLQSEQPLSVYLMVDLMDEHLLTRTMAEVCVAIAGFSASPN